jgi:anti-sigma28 factor (negative regulator of flagellin synthesis)
VNITVPSDHASVSPAGIDTVSVTSPGAAPSGSTYSPAPGGFSSDDHISVSRSTAKIQTDLSSISASQSSRVAKLAALYAAGRYEISSSKIAQSLVSGALAGNR